MVSRHAACRQAFRLAGRQGGPRAEATLPLPRFVPPQLSQPVEKPPSGPQWVHEIKLDGFRMAARIDNGRVQLLTRTGLDWTAKYPSAVAALANLNVKTAYHRRRALWRRRRRIAELRADAGGDRRRARRAARLLRFRSLAPRRLGRLELPLIERKALLEPLVANKPGLQFNGHDTGDGELILKHAGKLGFEGVVSKTIDAPYAPGNRGLWRKAKALNRQEFVIVGWSDPEGSRPHLGALLLGYYTDDGKLIYAGRVGTGMPVKVLADLRRRLDPLARKTSPLSVPPPRINPLRLAARSFARALGRAEARRRDHLSDLDGRRVASPHRVRRAAGGQARYGCPERDRARWVGQIATQGTFPLGGKQRKTDIACARGNDEFPRQKRVFLDGVANGSSNANPWLILQICVLRAVNCLLWPS